MTDPRYGHMCFKSVNWLSENIIAALNIEYLLLDG